MPDVEKLVSKLKGKPVEADLSDIRALLKAYGWEERTAKGSHYAFTKDSERTITIPTVNGRRVKRYYIGYVLERLGLDN